MSEQLYDLCAICLQTIGWEIPFFTSFQSCHDLTYDQHLWLEFSHMSAKQGHKTSFSSTGCSRCGLKGAPGGQYLLHASESQLGELPPLNRSCTSWLFKITLSHELKGFVLCICYTMYHHVHCYTLLHPSCVTVLRSTELNPKNEAKQRNLLSLAASLPLEDRSSSMF